MRISDWSSDVCSSDLVDVGDTAAQLQIVGDVPERGVAAQPVGEFLCPGVERRAVVALEYVLILGAARTGTEVDVLPGPQVQHHAGNAQQIGSASCRERVCQYV